LVVKSDHPHTKSNEPSGEGTSLAGTKLGKFGELATRDKPPAVEKDKAAEKKYSRC
jgi:hypothetical protein